MLREHEKVERKKHPKGRKKNSIIGMNSPNLAKNEKTLKKEKYKYFVNILYTHLRLSNC